MPVDVEPRPSSVFRWTEYLLPVLAVVLVLGGFAWLMLHGLALERAKAKRNPPPERRLELSFPPANAPSANHPSAPTPAGGHL